MTGRIKIATIGFYRNDNSGAQLSIIALHINFWILPTKTLATLARVATFRPTQKCYVDIGIRFTSSAPNPASIDFLPPTPWTKSTTFSDLSSEVLHESVAELVFGSIVTVNGNDVQYVQSDMDVGERVLRVDQLQDVGDGKYRVVFAPEIGPPRETTGYYARFRYECGHIDRILTSKGWGFAKRGWIFDLRVNDVRETVALSESHKNEEFADVDNCYVFIVAPNSFIPALSSPELQYTRLLELEVWKPYLLSCSEVSTSAKSTIYYWRSESKGKKAVSSIKPMRTYMHLHREFGWTIFALYGAGIVALPWLSDGGKALGLFLWGLIGW